MPTLDVPLTWQAESHAHARAGRSNSMAIVRCMAVHNSLCLRSSQSTRGLRASPVCRLAMGGAECVQGWLGSTSKSELRAVELCPQAKLEHRGNADATGRNNVFLAMFSRIVQAARTTDSVETRRPRLLNTVLHLTSTET